MTAHPMLLSLATATPPHSLTQAEVVSEANRVFAARFPKFAYMAPVFQNAGVMRRQFAMPLDWYLTPQDWPARAQAYDAAALDLFCAAALGALNEAGISGSDIDIVVTVSTTGISTPSLEAKAMARMGFRSDAARVPLFSLAFNLEALGKADIISTAIFGDGAAAAVLGAGAEGFAQVTGMAEHTWPDTLDVMGWDVGPRGLNVVLTRDLPTFVRKAIRPVMESMLRSQDLGLEDVDRFLCHPGGMKVVEAIEAAFDLGQGALDQERAVLADHGNMSSPTVLFVLDRARRDGLPRRSVLTALGPGFTAGTVTLEAA